MTQMRVSEAAEVLGVSTDTVRRAIDAGRLTPAKDPAGRTVVPAAEVAAMARHQAPAAEVGTVGASSPRNQLRAVVTRVLSDTVMTQVDMQAGPFRLVSLMSTEAAREMGLEAGSVVVASVKATQVAVGVPG
jgi:molybdopterin-binding protein